MKIIKLSFLLLIILSETATAQLSIEDSLAYKNREKELLDSLLNDNNSLELMKSLALHYREYGELEKSNEIFEKLIKTHNYYRSYFSIAYNYAILEEQAKSFDYIQNGLDLAPTDSNMFFGALFYHILDSNLKSLKLLEKILSTNDQHQAALSLYCDLKFYIEDSTDFFTSIQKLEKIDNSYSEVYKHYARYYYIREEYNKAYENINKAILLHSEDEYYFVLRGLLLYYLKKYELAIQDFLLFYDTDDYIILKNLYLGRSYAKLDSLENSFQYYMVLEPIMDDRFDYLDFYHLGVYYFNKDDFIKAGYFYEKSMNLDSNHSNTLNDIGLLYWYTKNDEKAQYYLKKSLLLDPDDIIVLQNYALFLAYKKDISGTIEVLDRLIQVDPDNIDVYEKAKQKLKNEGLIEF